MPSRPDRFLSPLRARIRRVQLVVGLGFFAFAVGSIISSQLALALARPVGGLGSFVLKLLVFVAVSRLWVYGVLPLFAYGVGRVFDVRPLPTALGAALIGELFTFAIQYVSAGLDGLHRHWGEAALRVLTLAGGVWLSHRLLVRGRAAAARAQAEASALAEANRARYAEFTAEAERLAQRREEVPVAAPRPDPQPDAPAEPPPGDSDQKKQVPDAG